MLFGVGDPANHRNLITLSHWPQNFPPEEPGFENLGDVRDVDHGKYYAGTEEEVPFLKISWNTLYLYIQYLELYGELDLFKTNDLYP